MIRSRNHIRSFLLFVCITFISIAGFAQADSTKKFSDYVSVRGYLKNMETVTWIPMLDSGSMDQLFHHRLNFRFTPVKNVQAGLEFRNRIFLGQSVANLPGYAAGIEQAARGYFDWSWLWLDESWVAGHTTIDRAWLEYSNNKWEARAGRQRINWGMNLGWNPNDIFNSYSLFDFDYEERPGVDALLVRRYFGATNQVAAGIAPGRTKDTWTAGALVRFNKWMYDWQFVAGWFMQDIAIGGGWAGNIKTVGFKGEFTYFHPQDNALDTLGALSLAANADYVFGSGLYVNGGFLINTIGLNGNNLTGAVAGGITAVPSPKNLMPSLFTAMATAMYPISPAVNSGLTILYIPGVHLTYAMPNFTYSVTENWDLDIIAQIFFADLGTGFDALGTAGFLRLKWSY